LHFTPALEQRCARAASHSPDHAACGRGHSCRSGHDTTATRCIRSGAFSRETADALNAARESGRIVAIGTTSLRLLESAATGDGTISHSPAIPQFYGLRFRASIPHDFPFTALDAVRAGVGFFEPRHDEQAYRHAITHGYRFIRTATPSCFVLRCRCEIKATLCDLDGVQGAPFKSWSAATNIEIE